MDISAATEKDLGSPDKGLDKNLMKLNKDKCKLLPLGGNNPV